MMVSKLEREQTRQTRLHSINNHDDSVDLLIKGNQDIKAS